MPVHLTDFSAWSYLEPVNVWRKTFDLKNGPGRWRNESTSHIWRASIISIALDASLKSGISLWPTQCQGWAQKRILIDIRNGNWSQNRTLVLWLDKTASTFSGDSKKSFKKRWQCLYIVSRRTSPTVRNFLSFLSKVIMKRVSCFLNSSTNILHLFKFPSKAMNRSLDCSNSTKSWNSAASAKDILSSSADFSSFITSR